jgi:hypothetical protein
MGCSGTLAQVAQEVVEEEVQSTDVKILFVFNHMIQNLCEFLFISGIVILQTLHISIVKSGIKIVPVLFVDRHNTSHSVSQKSCVFTQKKYLPFSLARNSIPSPLSCSTMQIGLLPIIFARRLTAFLLLGFTVTLRIVFVLYESIIAERGFS